VQGILSISEFSKNFQKFQNFNIQIMILKNDKYMLSGCELIDTEHISLASQNMKFVGEQADIFQYQ
jgi:hypothetical protein